MVDIIYIFLPIMIIYLIRIPFWKIDKIEQILDKELILHEDIV